MPTDKKDAETSESVSSPSKDPSTWNIWSILIAEILFIILPLLVIAIVLAFSGRMHRFLVTSEWSFATAILFGQALTKYVAGLVTGKIRVQWQRVILFFAILIVLGLVPSLIVLTLILFSELQSTEIVVPYRLAVAQIILFILGLGSYILFAGVGELALSKAEEYVLRTETKETPSKPI